MIVLRASTVLRKIKRHYLQYQSVCAVSIASRNISNRIKEMDRYTVYGSMRVCVTPRHLFNMETYLSP